MSVPHSVKQLRTADFLAWLVKGGAEVLPTTNPYEVARYRAFRAEGESRPALSVLYRRDNGSLTWTGDTLRHYQEFLDGQSLGAGAASVKAVRKATSRSAKRARLIPDLLARDGSDCWFCAEPLGEDVTLEHLVPKATGGKDHANNLVLAHRKCNNDAADKMIVEKLAMRRVKASS